jgi:NAD(P)-dependent dehydrogenase (short-subunit alcohol dehydrogenase family)
MAMTLNDTPLAGKSAVVTGGSRGIGRGVVRELAGAGARVFVTGRSVTDLPSQANVTALRCDHRDDAEVDETFDRILAAASNIDILVNAVWGGYEKMMEDGAFTWPRPFWQQPLWRWDAMFAAGVRAHYRAGQIAAKTMVGQQSGLIVNLSHWAAQKRIGNVAYGTAKAATDKMTSDMAEELKEHGVTVVSLYPGLVRTEKVMEAAEWLDLSNSESPEFSGRAVVALAADPERMRHSGKVRVVADLAREYGFSDVDGKTPRALTIGDV